MLVKTSGIVIKSTRYSESSSITKIYTRTHGMLSFIIQGVFSKSSRIKPSLLQPLQLLELDFYYKENQNLMRIKEARSLHRLNQMHFDPKRSTIVIVCAELIYKSIREEEKNEEMYDFLVQSIVTLDETDKNLVNFLLFFLLHFSKFLGFFPTNTYSAETPVFSLYDGIFRPHAPLHISMIEPPDSELLGRLIECEADQFDSLQIPRQNRHRLIDNMIDYYKIHVAGFEKLNSYEVLKSMYEK